MKIQEGIIMFKCNICGTKEEQGESKGKDGKYIYKMKEEKPIEVWIKDHYESFTLSGTLFLCAEHYIIALKNNW